jgi:hypothetical protein
MLAAQFGYLPGFLWILIGCAVGGSVHDMVILAASVKRDGKSLAEIAEAEGKSVDGLEQAILDGAKSALDEAVANERLTQGHADEIYQRLQSVIDELVNGTFPAPRGDRFGPGFGPPGFAPHDDGGDDDGAGGGASGDVLYWDTAA